ncbi:MAG TPA: peptide chain release factor N(5)-glutamine methyltransferase [Bryobacteraceae bacterium]|nr:peptide chain release factor N(5)-glutamine methyltransferase [Bryobacteraceae bacterium]
MTGPFLNIQTAIRQGTELLADAGVSDPRLHAEILLAHALHCERSYFYAHPERELREVEWLHFGRYLKERMAGKPTQYITGRQEFYGREFRVTPDVLIPRPETELLVELVLASGHKGRLVDVGTGSGAIAVSLALESQFEVLATDISLAALRNAAANALRLGAAVRFAAMDLVAALPDAGFDVVASNPPYVPGIDVSLIQREVRDWEPHVALFAGPRGLDVYTRLIPEAWRVLRPGGLLAMEFGFGQAESLEILTANWANVEIHGDLAGIPRVLTARKPT